MGVLVKVAKTVEALANRVSKTLVPRHTVQSRVDASRCNPATSARWAPATNGRVTQILDESTREETRSIARYEYLNNSVAAGFASTFALYVVGMGPVLQFQTKNPELNSHVESMYKAYCKRYGHAALCRQIMTCEVIDGESFAIVHRNPKLKYSQVAMTTIDPARIRNPNGMPSTAYMKDGIFYDVWGNVEKYCVLNLPKDNNYGYNVSDFTYYDADQVYHIHDKIFPETNHGMTWYLQSLVDFAQLREYGLAVLGAAKNQASVFAAVETELGYEEMVNINGENFPMRYDPFSSFPIPNSTLFMPPPKTKFNPVVPTQPMQTYDAYMNSKRTEMASPMLIPESKAVNSAARYNYSSVTADNAGFNSYVKVIQDRHETQQHDRFFEDWYLFAFPEIFIDFRDAPMPDELDNIFAWHWEEQPDVDQLKRADADAVNIANGTVTRKEICARKGVDFWKEVAPEIERERNLFPLLKKQNQNENSQRMRIDGNV